MDMYTRRPSDNRSHTRNLTCALACGRVWKASCILASPGGTMNSGTIRPLLNSVSNVYGVLSKRHTMAKLTDVFVLIDRALFH